MADFCYDCAEKIWGDPELNDFKGLCKPGETIIELCEGCGGYIEVDHEGKRIRMIKDLKGIIFGGGY